MTEDESVIEEGVLQGADWLYADQAQPAPYPGEPLPAPDPYYIEQAEVELRERALHAAMHPSLRGDLTIESALDRAAKILAFIKGTDA